MKTKALCFKAGTLLAGGIAGALIVLVTGHVSAQQSPAADRFHPLPIARDCAPGFTESGFEGVRNGNHSFRCTAAVACPAPSSSVYPGSIGAQAQTTGQLTATLSYSCRYDHTPQ